MEVNAIRTSLGEVPEVSDDHGKTWRPFEGIWLNGAVTEHMKELNEVLSAKR